MSVPSENETWLIEIGDAVIKKSAQTGKDSLMPWEILVYCLWAADYGIRNASDLDAAADVCPEFHSDGRRISKELSVPLTLGLFSLSRGELEEQYFDKFESICDEIKRAKPADTVDVGSRRPRKKP